MSILYLKEHEVEKLASVQDVVAGQIAGRTSPSDITLFKSGGLALEDVAVGKLVYERARWEGIGRVLDL
jgi:alanine dehydrogenase